MKSFTATLGIVISVLAILYNVHSADTRVHYTVEKAQKDLFDFLMTKSDQHLNRKPGLKTFKYNNCGNPAYELANLTSLVLGPDPLLFPGVLYVQFAVDVHTVVDTPVKADVLLEKKVGSNWLKIPCVGFIGSCTYDDVCELLSQIPECPEPFVDAGVPCQCPFQKGSYSLPQTEFDVEIPIFPSGDYHARANLTRNDDWVACVEIFATFA
ncbi:Ganglioside GM2 activator [Bulinus truncatus]|nr:Ganglioside GM2 activator [Bulinus truncatus]